MELSFSSDAARVLRFYYGQRPHYSLGIRLALSGRGCQGFHAQLSYDLAQKEDVQISGAFGSLILDPVTGSYLHNAKLDFFYDAFQLQQIGAPTRCSCSNAL
jgi:Fe-S cluster assembly iron-binding protein IscA